MKTLEKLNELAPGDTISLDGTEYEVHSTRKGAGANEGETISVRLEVDRDPATIRLEPHHTKNRVLFVHMELFDAEEVEIHD